MYFGYRIGIKVICVTCDYYFVNRQFLKLHEDGKSDSSVTHKMINPFAPEPEQHCVYYPPHLIITVHGASKKRNLWVR